MVVDDGRGSGRAFALAAAGGILAALGACAGPVAGPASPSPMPEYPPVAERADGGPRTDAQSLAVAGGGHRVAVRQRAQNCCKARNDCKGKGNCKTDRNACKGQNNCKGQGGCKPAVCP